MKKYCIYCGTEHAIEETVCRKCAKKLDPEENLLKDYLIAKTKDKLKGTVEDNLFELIKNYLLSHLYGVVVSVSVVFLATTSVFAGGGSSAPLFRVEHHTSQEEVERPGKNEITAEEKKLQDIVFKYVDIFSYDFDLNPHLVDSMLDYQLPASYGYSGQFDLFDAPYITDTPITLNCIFSSIEADPNTPATALGKQLVKDGYRIAEGVVERSQAYDDGEGTHNVLAENHYQITLVFMDERWYVAECVETYAKGEWHE